MSKTVKRNLVNVLSIVSLVLIVGLAVSLNGGAAYAAQDAAADGGKASSGSLEAQYTSFTTETSAPTAKPSNKASSYEAYSTYLHFTIGADSNLINYNMYMDIKRAGTKKWKTYEFNNYLKTYEITGLKPNKTYKARLYYGLNTSQIGPKSKVVTFKTGPNKKPAVKSIRVQAINVQKRYQKIYGTYTGVYLGKRAYYTYRIRTTVTFKKAPKEKYLTINGKTFKGGKKQYTVTTKKLVQFYDSPRGDSYTVSAYTFKNKSWKGYSRLYQRNFKIK